MTQDEYSLIAQQGQFWGAYLNGIVKFIRANLKEESPIKQSQTGQNLGEKIMRTLTAAGA